MIEEVRRLVSKFIHSQQPAVYTFDFISYISRVPEWVLVDLFHLKWQPLWLNTQEKKVEFKIPCLFVM